MEYKQLVCDFIERTRCNLHTLREVQVNNPDFELFEVTQLVNSLLGILVMPKERACQLIPTTSLTELSKSGWSIPQAIEGYQNPPNLQELVEIMRHSIAHFNVEFTNNSDGQISGLVLWNVNPFSKPKRNDITWKARITVEELAIFVDKLSLLMLDIFDKDTNGKLDLE